MKVRIAIGVALALASASAFAQHAGCPPLGARAPMSPPGPPPDFVPQITVGKTPDDPVKIEFQRPAGAKPFPDELGVEDGHLNRLPSTARAPQHPSMSGPAKGTALPNDVLSGWKLERTLAGAHRVERIYSRASGAWLGIEEWDFKTAGGSIQQMAEYNAQVGSAPARLSRMKGPSGCVASALSWEKRGKQFSVHVVGPLAVPEQRKVLEAVAAGLWAAP